MQYTVVQSVNPQFVIRDTTGDFILGILDHKGTVAYIYPNLNETIFSFTVNDTSPINRTQPFYHSTGDVTLRIRRANSTDSYKEFSTTDAYGGAARVVEVADSLIAYDITSLLNPGHGLNITRIYKQSTDRHGGFIIQVNVTNTQAYAQQLGALGMSMVFNNDWSGLDLNTTAQHCSITEPYIGQDNAWVKVTRISGEGPTLLVLPYGNGGMNAWRPLLSDPTVRSATFEGFYEYTFLADAYRMNEWKAVPDERLWTLTDSIVLQPGASVIYGLHMRLLPSVRDVESGLAQMQKLVVKVVPGYVVGVDMGNVTLFVLPGRYKISKINVSNSAIMDISNTSAILTSGWHAYQLYPRIYGRVRVIVHYSDDSALEYRQVVSMFVLPSFRTHIQTFGEFNAKYQWYDDPADPFGRSQSIMPYNWHSQQLILQESRSFVVGLSDESGAGPGLGFAVKNQYAPESDQVHLLDLYINNTLFGSKGPSKYVPFETRVQWRDYTVVASTFWYPGMPGYNYTITDGWDQKRANTTWRSYNYVHPTAIYYSLYRIARDNPNITTLQTWSWYLMQAYQTYVAMVKFAAYYSQFGLMVGSVFLRVLDALRIEGYVEEFQKMLALEQTRVSIWQSLPFPFGSEFPWDSTGQEEIYLTAQYFGLYNLSNSTLQAVLAYTHSIPNWGYHGAARRFWDYVYNGCEELNDGIERVLHHYGSGLNALPILHAYDLNPDDIYLLEVGIGSITGPLTNIQLSGASSMGLHGDPRKLIHDYWDADYGMAFYGLASLQSAYAVNHTILGEAVCYLCDLTLTGETNVWNVTPRDAFHRRVYIEPLGTAFSLDAGMIESIVVNWHAQSVVIVLSAVKSPVPFTVYRLHVDHLASCNARTACDLVIVSPANPPVVRGAFEIAVQPYPQTMSVKLKWNGKYD
ncbi:unnamed protein product [Adineta ricciae]|uniref:Uncharacterized protein n=1 Tax=Adineta ricciae TaxID=249248 RepID=A0A814C8A4_ADIRI|nr:unnamed protein product [Adineta ricciae]CAF1458016.1 unnamed protein product [Adineta ricciae]